MSTTPSSWAPVRCGRSLLLVGLLTILGDLPNATAQERSIPSDTLETFNIQGTVTDEFGTAIPGVHIYLVQNRRGTTTDRDGTYRLKSTRGSFTIRCSAVGYESLSREILVADDIVWDCVLRATVLDAGEVVVIASRRPQLAREVPSSLEVLPAELLKSRNVGALDEALQNVSGVQVQGNQINIRGTSGFAYNTGSRVLLLIDGMPVLSPDSDGLPLDALPATQIQQIEVLKGPGSALYGSGALGGVVNVVTVPVPDRNELSFRTYIGAYEPTRHSAWSDRWKPARDWRPFVGAALSISRKLSHRSGGWLSLDFREDPGFTNLSSDRQLQSLAKLRFSPTAATSLDVLAAFVARRRDSYFFWNGLTDALNPGSIQLSQSSTPSGSNDNFTTLLMLQPQLTHRAGASIINVRLRGYATLIRPINDDGSLKPLSQGTAGARFGGEFQWQRFLANSNQIIGGLAIDANATKSSFYQTADGGSAGRQPEAGLYAQWESRPLPRVSSVAGLRYDRFRISSRETTQRLSPKLAVGYDVIPGLTLRTSFGLGFRVPSLAERYTDDQSFFPIFKNPFIRPERSTSLEAGARGFLDVFEEWSIDWDVAAFSYWLQDLIEPRFVRAVTSGGTQLGFQFVNVPNGWVRGLESRVEFARSSGVRVRAGHTLLTSRDAETMAPLPFRPQHLVVLGVDLTARRLNLGLDYRYASRPETVDSDFARFVPDADILVDTQVVDVVLGMRTGVTAVRFIVRNALNHYHLERPALLAAPRSFIIQLSATL